MTTGTQIIGLVPAAGKATRMGALPFSKELLPLRNFSPVRSLSSEPVKRAIENTLETFASAGINDTCVIVAPAKIDIRDHLGDGSRYGQNLVFVETEASPSVPFSLDVARPYTQNREVALLFPDIVFEPQSALRDIVVHRRRTTADLVLALVPAANGEKIDLVSVSKSGSIEKVTPKPGAQYSGWTWVAATWNAEFSEFLHLTVENASDTLAREMYVADVMNAAIDAGFALSVLFFRNGNSFDLGTPDELDEFWRSGLI